MSIAKNYTSFQIYLRGFEAFNINRILCLAVGWFQQHGEVPYNIIVFVQKGGRDLPSKLIMKGITYLKELKKIMRLTMVWHNIT